MRAKVSPKSVLTVVVIEGTGQRSAHRLDVGRQTRPLAHHGDVDVSDAVTGAVQQGRDALQQDEARDASHLGIPGGEVGAEVAQPGAAEFLRHHQPKQSLISHHLK